MSLTVELICSGCRDPLNDPKGASPFYRHTVTGFYACTDESKRAIRDRRGRVVWGKPVKKMEKA